MDYKFVKEEKPVAWSGDLSQLPDSSYDLLESVNERLENKVDNGEAVPVEDVLRQLGFDELDIEMNLLVREGYGWTKDRGLHRLTTRELNPNGCPYCGRPWPKDSE